MCLGSVLTPCCEGGALASLRCSESRVLKDPTLMILGEMLDEGPHLVIHGTRSREKDSPHPRRPLKAPSLVIMGDTLGASRLLACCALSPQWSHSSVAPCLCRASPLSGEGTHTHDSRGQGPESAPLQWPAGEREKTCGRGEQSVAIQAQMTQAQGEIILLRCHPSWYASFLAYF